MSRPELTLIVTCGSDAHLVRGFIDHLVASQPVAAIEILLVTRKGQNYLPLVTAPFAGKRQLHFDARTGLNEACAQAVRMAAGEIVLFLEDHSRLEGDWVRGLPRLFEGGYAAVGWPIRPIPQPSVASLTGYLIEYGCWGPAVPPGEKDGIPGHNCAYRRDALLRMGPELASMLRAESILHARLRQEGEKLFFTTELTLTHFQFRALSASLRVLFWYGWNFADARQQAGRWSLLRRCFHALASPLFPILRWKRLIATPRDPSLPDHLLWRCAFPISLTLAAASAGEAMGHLFGTWQAPAKLNCYLDFAREQG